MKKLILMSFSIILFMSLNITLFAQETEKQDLSKYRAGTDAWFMISINNQSPVKAKILSINDDWMIIKEKNGTVRDIDPFTITGMEEADKGSLGTVGVGFGVPYAGLGINGEINVIPYMSLTAAFGTTIIVGMAYDVGIKAYFRKQETLWRPRASLYYGTNGFHYVEKDHPDNKQYTGFTAGLGQIFMWQKHGFDLDLMYVVSSKLLDEPFDTNWKFKFSIGYRYAF